MHPPRQRAAVLAKSTRQSGDTQRAIGTPDFGVLPQQMQVVWERWW